MLPKDYVDWCGNLLHAVIRRADDDPRQAAIGVNAAHLAVDFFGERAGWRNNFPVHPLVAVRNACRDLAEVGLLTERIASTTGKPSGLVDPTSAGRQAALDPTILWMSVCEIVLERLHADVLCAINQISQTSVVDNAVVAEIKQGDMLATLESCPRELDILQLIGIVRELERMGFVQIIGYSAHALVVRSVYKGVVWETRRDYTVEAREITEMVARGETTSTEIKRQVDTDTKDQKAEFIKDVLGLANTQANPPHVLLIGFDDKTGAYFGPPNAKLTQNHIEQLLSEYAAPPPVVRYRVVACPFGSVGRLDIERDPRFLPYRVKTSVGDGKRIEAGMIFVRHGSQTARADADEAAALVLEADRANSAR